MMFFILVEARSVANYNLRYHAPFGGGFHDKVLLRGGRGGGGGHGYYTSIILEVLCASYTHMFIFCTLSFLVYVFFASVFTAYPRGRLLDRSNSKHFSGGYVSRQCTGTGRSQDICTARRDAMPVDTGLVPSPIIVNILVT